MVSERSREREAEEEKREEEGEGESALPKKEKGASEAHQRIVTIVFPFPASPHFCANRTQVTRLTAEDEPRKRPSSRARWRDMATASASVTLFRRVSAMIRRGAQRRRTGRRRR